MNRKESNGTAQIGDEFLVGKDFLVRLVPVCCGPIDSGRVVLVETGKVACTRRATSKGQGPQKKRGHPRSTRSHQLATTT